MLRSTMTRGALGIHAALIFCWLANLAPTDGYYSVYLLCGVLALLCLCANYRSQPLVSRRTKLAMAMAAALFSGAAALANYPVFEPITALLSLFNLALTLLGGGIAGWHILLTLVDRLPLRGVPGPRRRPGLVFWGVFLAAGAINLSYLLFASFPGVLTKDSVSTILQIQSGVYNNTMPYYHTMTVRVFYQLGMALFGEVNGAVATVLGAQGLFLAACYGFALTTLYQARVPGGVILGLFCLYALLPHSIAYSVTLWKDVPFGAAALLLVTALYRLLRGIGKGKWRDLLLLVLGCVGFSLWRTNGWYAFAVTTAVLLLAMGRKQRKLVALLVLVLALCWVLIGPALEALEVESTNLVEAFAVPMQQVARVVASGAELTEPDRQLLEQAFLLDKVGQLYLPGSVDPIKFETFRYDQVPYILDHWQEYLRLYLRLGLRYPGEYLKAWVEETKGFWNGGYDYWRYQAAEDIPELGLMVRDSGNLLSRLFRALFRYVEKPVILQPLVSIGLYVWAIFSCFFVNLWGRRQEYLLSIPLMVLCAGLWLGTPVYAEFRYAYPMVLTAPLIAAVTLYHPDKEEDYAL